MKRLSIYSIALTGIFVGLITAFKLMDQVMPRIGGYAVWEIYWTVGALAVIALPWVPALLVLFVSSFVWLAIGQTEPEPVWGFALDYIVPMMGLIFVKFAKNKWLVIPMIIIAFGIKLFAHTWSGVLYWEVDWKASALEALPYTGITAAITLPIAFTLNDQLRKIKSNTITNKENRY